MQHSGTGLVPGTAEVADHAAQSLLEAYRTRQPIPPLVSTFPELTIDDAYRIQLAQVDTWLTGGRRILGRKVGLTSRPCKPS